MQFIPSPMITDMSHMYNFTDYRSPIPERGKICTEKNSLYGFISDPKYSKFKRIVDRAGYASNMNDIQAQFTLFVPSDDVLSDIPYDYFEFMDDGLARQIINASTIQRPISKKWLISSPVCYFYTKNPKMRMYITNIGGITNVNNCAKVLEYDIMCVNGIIHTVSNIVAPNEDTFMN
jgi:hypothetical protein